MGTLCAAHRLRDDLFHDAVLVQILCSQLHDLAGFAAAGGILPQDAGKAFGAQHRVDGVFQHQDAVCHTQRQCAAGGALAGDHCDHRHGQAAHLHQVAGNGFALSALLGILAGVRTRGVDKGDDGTVKFFGLLHQAQGLAVALRPGHTKVAAQVFFQRAALAVADDRDRLAMEQCHTAQNGGIFLALAVAALLKEVGERSG